MCVVILVSVSLILLHLVSPVSSIMERGHIKEPFPVRDPK